MPEKLELSMLSNLASLAGHRLVCRDLGKSAITEQARSFVNASSPTGQRAESPWIFPCL